MVDSFSKDGFLLSPLVEDRWGKRPRFSCEVHSAKKATSAVASGAVASGAVTSGSVTSGPVTSGVVASGPVASGAVTSGPVASGTIKHSREHSVDRQPSKKGPGYVWDFIPEPVSGIYLWVFDIHQQKWVRSEMVD